MSKFAKALNWLLNIFDDAMFPEFTCFICGREVKRLETHLCDRCEKEFPILKTEKICLKCGAPVNDLTHYCDDCKYVKFDFDEARACFEYTDKTRKLALGIKYQNKKYLAKFFARIMFEKISEWGVLIDIIVPVPTSCERLKMRGYNQSELIANELATLIGVPVRTDIVERKDTAQIQEGLTRAQRMENMKGVFKVSDKHSLRGNNVLIVDDVFTTGATVNELSITLRGVRPDKIYVLTAGKTLIKYNKKQK